MWDNRNNDNSLHDKKITTLSAEYRKEVGRKNMSRAKQGTTIGRVEKRKK